jgi:phosphatidylglycerophosphatase A
LSNIFRNPRSIYRWIFLDLFLLLLFLFLWLFHNCLVIVLIKVPILQRNIIKNINALAHGKTHQEVNTELGDKAILFIVPIFIPKPLRTLASKDTCHIIIDEVSGDAILEYVDDVHY